MASNNVELVRSYFAAANGEGVGGLIRRLEPVLDTLGPDFELDLSRSISPEAGVYRGPEEIKDMFRVRGEVWSRIEAFETEIIDAGDVVVRVGGFRAVGDYTGIELAAQGASVWRFEDGEPVSMRLYQTKDEALEAAGIAS
jgi:ketosteroid isomerase-like protein